MSTWMLCALAASGGAVVAVVVSGVRRFLKVKESIWMYFSPVKREEDGKYYWKITPPWERQFATAHTEFEFRCDKKRGHILLCTWCGHLKTFDHDLKAGASTVGKPLAEAMEEHIRDMQSVGIL